MQDKINNQILGCIGCGVCVNSEPDVFGLGDDGLAEIIDEAKFEQFNINDANWDCPVSAINK